MNNLGYFGENKLKQKRYTGHDTYRKDLALKIDASDAYWAFPFSAFASKFATTWLVESGPLEGALFGFKESSLGALKGIGVPGLLDKNCKRNASDLGKGQGKLGLLLTHRGSGRQEGNEGSLNNILMDADTPDLM